MSKEMESFTNMIYKVIFSSLLILLFLPQNGKAQVGLNGYYTSLSESDWESLLPDNTTWPLDEISGFEYGIDGYFRLKDLRIEFFPELRYGQFSFKNKTTDEKVNIAKYGIYFQTRFYLFNMEGDCNCPTFSKKDPFFHKGFFVSVTPGYSILDLPTLKSTLNKPPKSGSFLLGFGAGLDIGISDLITLTPSINYFYHFQHKWQNLAKMVQPEPHSDDVVENSSTVGAFSLGLRLGFRFDYKAPFGGRRR